MSTLWSRAGLTSIYYLVKDIEIATCCLGDHSYSVAIGIPLGNCLNRYPSWTITNWLEPASLFTFTNWFGYCLPLCGHWSLWAALVVGKSDPQVSLEDDCLQKKAPLRRTTWIKVHIKWGAYSIRLHRSQGVHGYVEVWFSARTSHPHAKNPRRALIMLHNMALHREKFPIRPKLSQGMQES